jgi:hypothetical protein
MNESVTHSMEICKRVLKISLVADPLV